MSATTSAQPSRLTTSFPGGDLSGRGVALHQRGMDAYLAPAPRAEARRKKSRTAAP